VVDFVGRGGDVDFEPDGLAVVVVLSNAPLVGESDE
jgi:hypothetical protein